MSASKVLDLAERQGLLDAKAIGELRKQVAESKFVVTPEAVAKILVDKGHLTAFQARRLVSSALEEPDAGPVASAPPKPKRDKRRHQTAPAPAAELTPLGSSNTGLSPLGGGLTPLGADAGMSPIGSPLGGSDSLSTLAPLGAAGMLDPLAEPKHKP